jgi:ribosome biogenesis SPOUT family RNA methylase Rps3
MNPSISQFFYEPHNIKRKKVGLLWLQSKPELPPEKTNKQKIVKTMRAIA